MIELSTGIVIPENEITWHAMRSQGAGGQNVNKVATAIHLRFDINQSSLPEDFKERLLALRDKRITKDGVIIIKAQSCRTQEANKQQALQRLQSLLESVAKRPKSRIATKPTKSARLKRLANKRQRSEIKNLRQAVRHDD